MHSMCQLLKGGVVRTPGMPGRPGVGGGGGGAGAKRSRCSRSTYASAQVSPPDDP